MSSIKAVPSLETGDFQPDYVVSPGTVLRAELDARGLTQADLATRTGLSPKHVNQVVKDVAPLSADVALLLERTLGVPSRVWNTLESRQREVTTKKKSQLELASHADWLSRFPTKELVSRGVLSALGGAGARVDQLLTFFGVADPTAWERIYAEPVAAFRRAQHLSPDSAATAVWLRLAEQQVVPAGEGQALASYSARAFRQLLPKLRALTTEESTEQAFQRLQQLCASVGVRVVYVPQLKGTGINGATRWLGDHPLIALSDRYKWADTFWFSFFHEVGHVLSHPRRCTYVALPDKGDDQDGLEAEADQFAADQLIPPSAREALARLKQRTDVIRFAEQIGVDPGIVAGRLGTDTRDWKFANGLKLRRQVDLSQDV